MIAIAQRVPLKGSGFEDVIAKKLEIFN